MPMYDYRCIRCGEIFEAFVPYAERYKQACPCGGATTLIWRRAPGVQGEENVDREMLRAARGGITYGTGNQPIEPFSGSTRSELKSWMSKNGLAAVPTSEFRRGVTINSKTDFTKTPEFQRRFDGAMREALDVARAGPEAVRSRVAECERPNDFDAKAFAEQQAAGLAVLTGDEKAKQAAPVVAEDVREVTPLIAEELRAE